MSAEAKKSRRDTAASALGLLSEARTQLDYLALHMHSAFDGGLDSEHANAYCALTATRAALLDLEEVIKNLGRRIEDLTPSPVKSSAEVPS